MTGDVTRRWLEGAAADGGAAPPVLATGAGADDAAFAASLVRRVADGPLRVRAQATRAAGAGGAET